jgi:hypothetical protein
MKTIMYDKNGVPFFRERKYPKDETFVDLSLEQCGYTKSLSVKVIIKREGFSEKSFTRKIGYFVTELTYQIPNDLREFRMCWFYYDKRHMDSICIKSFATKEGYAYSINPLDRDFLKSKSKPIRVTENEVRAMIQNREVLGIFSEGSEGVLEELAT